MLQETSRLLATAVAEEGQLALAVAVGLLAVEELLEAGGTDMSRFSRRRLSRWLAMLFFITHVQPLHHT